MGSYLAVLVWYGYRTFRDVPLLDDYALALRAGRLEGASDLPGYLFERHNEHLCLTARLVFAAAGETLHFDFSVLRWLNLGLLLAVGLLAARFAVRCAGPARSAAWSSLGGAAAFLIAASLVQWELLQTTMCVSNLVSQLSSMLALASLARGLASGRPVWLVVAAAAILLAYWNLASGAITAAVGAAMLAVFARSRRRLLLALFGSLAVVLLWLQHQAGSGTGFSLSRAFAYLEGTLSILGLAVVPVFEEPSFEPAIRIAGAIVVLLAVGFAVRLGIDARKSPGTPDGGLVLAFGLIVHGLATCAAIAYGRVGFGTDGLTTSRYYPFAMLVGLGLLLAGIRFCALHPGRPRRAAAVALALLFGVGQACGSWWEMRESWHRQQTAEAMMRELPHYRELSDARLLELTYLGPEHIGWLRESLAYLEENRYSFFRRP